MSLSRYGPTCEPSEVGEFVFGLMQTPEPTHDGCPGGHSSPGLIGGWTCPCGCHRAAPKPETTVTP